MKTIYLLRHGKAELGAVAMSDHERPLAERGKDNAAATGRFLLEQQWPVDRIACSSSKRTRETLEALLSTLHPMPEHQMDESLYLASFGDLITHMQQLDGALNHVLYIGHNPGMHEASLNLTGTDLSGKAATLSQKLPTCGLVKLTFSVNDWAAIAPYGGTLEGFWTRHDLAAYH